MKLEVKKVESVDGQNGDSQQWKVYLKDGSYLNYFVNDSVVRSKMIKELKVRPTTIEAQIIPSKKGNYITDFKKVATTTEFKEKRLDACVAGILKSCIESGKGTIEAGEWVKVARRLS